MARVLAGARTLMIEQRAGGMAFRFEARDAGNRCQLTCVVHEPPDGTPLTASEREVADRLCDGLTLAQIARLRGVSINTVKSQARQIFRKLDVDSRVALVRRLCP
jgi:DNA-binding CsgD family transcriptional regulator